MNGQQYLPFPFFPRSSHTQGLGKYGHVPIAARVFRVRQGRDSRSLWRFWSSLWPNIDRALNRVPLLGREPVIHEAESFCLEHPFPTRHGRNVFLDFLEGLVIIETTNRRKKKSNPVLYSAFGKGALKPSALCSPKSVYPLAKGVRNLIVFPRHLPIVDRCHRKG